MCGVYVCMLVRVCVYVCGGSGGDFFSSSPMHMHTHIYAPQVLSRSLSVSPARIIFGALLLTCDRSFPSLTAHEPTAAAEQRHCCNVQPRVLEQCCGHTSHISEQVHTLRNTPGSSYCLSLLRMKNLGFSHNLFAASH